VAISGADVTLGTPSVTSATALTVSVTIGAGAAIGSRTITVTTGAEVVTAAFAVTAGAPVIALSPDSGAQASSPTVTITGTFTHFSAGVTTVAISGAGVTLGTPSVTSATVLTVSATIAAGAALGVRTVTVTTGAEVTTADFEITEILCTKRERGTISPEQIQAQFRQGNSPVVLMAAGEFIPGNVIVSDECGNAVDGGAAPGGGFFVNGVPV
jgi:hypothetical protein